jgi:hypothetical protein
VLLLILLCTPASTAENLLQDSVKVAKNAHLYRNLALGNMVGGSAAYFYFANTWGAPTGKFHLKDEIHDNLNGTDEHSHLFAGYKLTEGFRWLFRLLKVEPQSLDRCAAIQAALVVTLVEFPMDAYNPTQGLGATDLVADYAGVGLAILKHRYPNNFDMKMSAKRPPWDFENKFLSSKNEEFDNFIWWGTWKPKYVWLGVGYSTNHFRADGKVSSEVYLSIGTTLYDLLHLGWPQMADEVKSLDTYFICLKAKVL